MIYISQSGTDRHFAEGLGVGINVKPFIVLNSHASRTCCLCFFPNTEEQQVLETTEQGKTTICSVVEAFPRY